MNNIYLKRTAISMAPDTLAYDIGVSVDTLYQVESQKNLIVCARIIEAIAGRLTESVAMLGFSPVRCKCHSHILRKLRERKNISLQRAAELVSTDTDYMHACEQGNYKSMSVYMRNQLAKIYNVSVGFIHHYNTEYEFLADTTDFRYRITDENHE